MNLKNPIFVLGALLTAILIVGIWLSPPFLGEESAISLMDFNRVLARWLLVASLIPAFSLLVIGAAWRFWIEPLPDSAPEKED